jgi:hypothetical protein
VLFHNEVEEWKAVQPQIGAADVRDDGRALRLMIAVGAGMPEHYLAEGGNANRATAAEMGLPAIKRFQRRQEYFRQVSQARSRCGHHSPSAAVRSGVGHLSKPERGLLAVGLLAGVGAGHRDETLRLRDKV